MKIRKTESATKGPMFLGHKDRHVSISEMDILFHTVLLDEHQKYPSVLPDTVDVKVEFSTF